MYATNNPEGLRQRVISQAPQQFPEGRAPLHEDPINVRESRGTALAAADPLRGGSDPVTRSSGQEAPCSMRSSANTSTWSDWAWSWVPSFGYGTATADELPDRFEGKSADNAKVILRHLAEKADELSPELSSAEKAKLQGGNLKGAAENPSLFAQKVDEYFECFSRRLAYPAINSLFQGLVYLAWPNLEISGLENIPRSGSVIFVVAPHQSHMDGPTVIRAINCVRSERSGDLRVRPAASSHLFELKPPIGWAVGALLKVSGSIPIERDGANRASARARLMSTKRDLDKEDTMVMIFPEGGRNRGDTISIFASGAFDLAITAKKPVVPVLIDGTRQMWHPNSKGLIGLLSSWGRAVGQRFYGTSPVARVSFMKPMLIVDKAPEDQGVNEAHEVKITTLEGDEFKEIDKYHAKALIRQAASDFTGWAVKDERLVPHGGTASLAAAASNDETDAKNIKIPASKL